MKTLYIPTTTLNFNNIMSSESISPKAFYMERKFGYKTWTPIDENPFDNSILLYEKMPMIKRSKSDYDDYPMIIAVDLSTNQLNDMHQTNTPGVWQCDKTIYLTPSSTKIFFDSEEHQHIALSKSESSAETKMVTLYQDRMLCESMEEQYDISSCKDIATLNQKDISRDQQINKMKGLLYGYYVGAAMSMKQEDVVQLNIFKKIKNVFTAILASLDGKETKEQHLQLNELFEQLKQSEPLDIQLKEIIESTDTTEEKQNRIREEINRIITAVADRDSRYKDYYSFSFQFLLNKIQKGESEDGGKAISWVNEVIKNHIEKIRLHKELLRPESGEIQLSSLSLSSINTKNLKQGKPQELFKAIVNDVLATNKYNGKISTFRQDLATAITEKAKEVFAEEWNDSCQAKKYLNALRKHIEGAPFDQKWGEGVLSSIISVVLKGDDWEKLLEFLETKEITDYRLAFAVYGVLNGFANITRDFSDIILGEEKKYVEEVYQFFHKQLHETDVYHSDIPSNKPVTENANKQTNASLIEKTQTEDKDICKSSDVADCSHDTESTKPSKSSKKTSVKSKEPELAVASNERDKFSDQNIHFIRTLQVIQAFNETQISRLIDNWDYTGQKHKNDSLEHLKHFINLCCSESRGEKPNYIDLKDAFTEDIANKFKTEIANKLNLNGRKA